MSVFFVSIFLDQFSKYSIRSMGGFYICNKNLAFGISITSNQLYSLLILIVFFIIFIASHNWKLVNSLFAHLNSTKGASETDSLINVSAPTYNDKLLITKALPLILILSGAISNIIDRLYFGCVIDFIDLQFWSVFNLADVYITTGAIILILNNSKRVTLEKQ
jgi:hypothetical protein